MIRETWRLRPGQLAERLAAEIREEIAGGNLTPGTPLPSERDLATAARTSRTTVGLAMEILAAGGWVDRFDRARAIATLPDSTAEYSLAPSALGASADVIDIVGARIAAPADEVNRAVEAARTQLTPHLIGDGRQPFGLGELRERVAQRFTETGLRTTTEQIMITNGAIGALEAVLGSVRGSVLVEDPTYHRARQIMVARKRRLIAWPRASSWDFDRLDALLRADIGVSYLVPDFHNPTGELVGDRERKTLASRGRRLGTVVIDETLRELHIDSGRSQRPPHLAAYLTSAVTIGGLSKTVWSGLRIGWMRVPSERKAEFVRFSDAQPVPVFDQLIALALWDDIDGIVGARINRLRIQRDHLVDSLRAGGIAVARPSGGLVCWVDLGRPIATSVARRLAERGVLVAPGPMFSASRSFDRYLRIPFTPPVEVLTRVVDSLVGVLAET